jgi:DNA-binding protein HU-beta
MMWGSNRSPTKYAKEEIRMSMTKSEVSRYLADKVGITKKQSDAFLEALAELAYAEAKNTFVVPGIGKLSLKESPAREATMPFGPRKGEKYVIPAKKKVKFTVAKAAKDAITGSGSGDGGAGENA